MNQSILFIKIPENIKEKESAMEGFLHALHQLMPNGTQVSLEMVSSAQFLRFYIVIEEKWRQIVMSQLFAHYPDIEIEQATDYLTENLKNAAIAQIDFQHTSINPLSTFRDKETNFISLLSAILAKTNAEEQVYFQITLKKIGSKFHERGIGGMYRKITTNALEDSNKFSQDLYQGKLRIAYLSPEKSVAENNLAILVSLLKNVKSNHNELKKRKLFVSKDLAQQFKLRTFTKGDYWSAAELATLYHLPYSGGFTSNIVHTTSKRAPAPETLPREGYEKSTIATIGETNYRNEKFRFGILDTDRRRHMYVIGKTGVGKSRFLELLMKADIEQNKGFCLLDPHGDLAQAVLKRIPQNRIKDVVYVDPSNRDFPIAFNPLEYTQDYEKRQHIAFFFIAIFKKIFAADWNERMEHILRYIILALLETPDANILGIPRILSDAKYRHQVINQLQDPVVKQFWASEFAQWNEQYATQAIVPILNKVGQFVANPIIRNMVGQQKNTLNFEHFMNTGKIVIINVSKGKLGEDNASLLGSMFITKIQQAALARANIREDDRRDFYFYIDEFQNFATEAFKSILSESRKYRLNLTIAHQYIEQLSPDLRSSVFGNVASLFVFAVGADDAHFLSKEFAPTFSADDIIGLETRDMYVKMSINGKITRPFSARTITTDNPSFDFTPEIITNTQTNYATSRIVVEKAIEQWAKTGRISEVRNEESFPEPIL